MKRLLFLLFIFICFAAGANAQVCGQFTTTLMVKTEDNKAVENSVVQLVALGKDETKNKTFVRDETDRSKFSITFNEGHVMSGKYKIIVSADGFETAEKEVGFPHCKHQYFEFNLKAVKSNEAILTGTVYAPNGAVIPGAKITAVNQKWGKFEARTNDEGIYVLNLSFNLYDSKTASNFKIAKYEITVESVGFKKSIAREFLFVQSYLGKMQFDIALEEVGAIQDVDHP
jgi:hypothetical protein